MVLSHGLEKYLNVVMIIILYEQFKKKKKNTSSLSKLSFSRVMIFEIGQNKKGS